MAQETAYLTRIRFQAAPQTTISTLPLPTQRPPSIIANGVPAASSGEKFYAQIFATVIGNKMGTVLVQQRQRAAHMLKKGNADKQVKRRHGGVLH